MLKNNPPDLKNWLETDEFLEAVFALQLTKDQLSQLASTGNLYHWIWVIVSLHNTLQGFMVLALHGPNNINVLTEACATEWLAAFEQRDRPYPKPRLDTYLNLYKKVKSKRMIMYIHSKSFVPSGTQGRSVKKLNLYRNEFIHFVPKGQLFEVSGLPLIVEDCLDMISFLAFESGNIFWHEQELETQTRELLDRSKQNIVHIRKEYDSERDRE